MKQLLQLGDGNGERATCANVARSFLQRALIRLALTLHWLFGLNLNWVFDPVEAFRRREGLFRTSSKQGRSMR